MAVVGPDAIDPDVDVVDWLDTIQIVVEPFGGWHCAKPQDDFGFRPQWFEIMIAFIIGQNPWGLGLQKCFVAADD